MKSGNKTILLWSIVIILGLTIVVILTKINIKLANIYPEMASIIFAVYGIGIIAGIFMISVVNLLNLLISKLSTGEHKKSIGIKKEEDID